LNDVGEKKKRRGESELDPGYFFGFRDFCAGGKGRNELRLSHPLVYRVSKGKKKEKKKDTVACLTSLQDGPPIVFGRREEPDASGIAISLPPATQEERGRANTSLHAPRFSQRHRQKKKEGGRGVTSARAALIPTMHEDPKRSEKKERGVAPLVVSLLRRRGKTGEGIVSGPRKRKKGEKEERYWFARKPRK